MILRTRLLARLIASEPRLVQLYAPAGYGKASLARLFARRFDRHAVCNCDGISGSVEFAGRVMRALADESQGGGDAVAVTRLRLHASRADTATWSRALLEAWKSRQERALLIIENAEAIADDRAVVALLGDMLATRPSERIVLVSSRVPLPLRAAHYLAPHQIVTFSQHELRFDGEDLESVFDGTELAPEITERIVRLADGWPMVVSLLARFAHYEANVGRLIDRLEDVPFANLHEYLANEILSALTPDMMSTMLAAAAIPDASLEDISAATGISHVTPVLDGLLRLPGFLSLQEGSYHAHPLLRAALRSRHEANLAEYVLRAARENERIGDLLRAAELHEGNGDDGAAAAALDRLPAAALAAPSGGVIDALARIPMATLCAYPNLWIATLRYRRQHVDVSKLYEEAARLLQSVSADRAPSLFRRLRVRLAMFAHELEHLSEARALLEDDRTPAVEETPEERRLALMTSAVIAAKQGRLSDADRFVEYADAVPGARHMRFDRERDQIAVEKVRLPGDWPELLKVAEEALHAAQRSGVTSDIIDAARSVASAAWYCNDDGRVTSANQILVDCGYTGARTFAHCVQEALSRRSTDAPARMLNMARWHAALTTTDARQAHELFDLAIDGIDAVENDVLRIVMRVSAALLLPAQRRRLLEAHAIAQRVESPPIQASLELLIDSTEPSDYGIFKHMASRVARSPLKVRRDVLFIDVVRGEVRRGNDQLHVSDRGLELLLALALLEATSKEALAEAIWPGLDSDAALNALKMCISRTRAQVGDRDAIVSTKRGYQLNECVATDIRDLDRLVRKVHSGEHLSQTTRREVEDAVRTLSTHRRKHGAGWAWFTPHEAHLDALRHEFTVAVSDAQEKKAFAVL
jgi:DNA-binding winged helix-turn-helix (wHTH) protein